MIKCSAHGCSCIAIYFFSDYYWKDVPQCSHHRSSLIHTNSNLTDDNFTPIGIQYKTSTFKRGVSVKFGNNITGVTHSFVKMQRCAHCEHGIVTTRNAGDEPSYYERCDDCNKPVCLN